MSMDTEKGLGVVCSDGSRKSKVQFFLQNSIDGIGIAKYCSISLVFAHMKMKVPFVSRTVGTIHFISSLTLWFCE